jgi:hypothetical protein
MISEKLKELEALKQRAAALEQEVVSERRRELSALPKQFGYDTAEAFVAAVIEATGARMGGAGRRPRGPKAPKPERPAGKRTRARITDETRAQVKKLVEAGKTGAEIAQEVGISLPSVQNIKKALGLVQERK